jgi:hypothetical protein
MNNNFADKYLCLMTGIKIIKAGYFRVLSFKSNQALGGAWRSGRESKGIEKGNGGLLCEMEKEKLKVIGHE